MYIYIYKILLIYVYYGLYLYIIYLSRYVKVDFSLRRHIAYVLFY